MTDERTVRCPVEGCEQEVLARGINLHIRRSADDRHGPQGEVPDGVDLSALETIGSEAVEMDYPEERDTEEVTRLCPYCGVPFSGANGVLIHLGQTAGRKNHPENVEDLTDDDFPRVEADDDGNVTSVESEVLENAAADTGKGGVSLRRISHLLAELLADGEPETAGRVRRHLLGADASVRAEDHFPDVTVLKTLLVDGRVGQSGHKIAAVLERDGIMVAFRSEAACLTAAEARSTARKIERAAAIEGWTTEDTTDFIEFLRYGADVIDGEKAMSGLQIAFHDWR